MLIVRSSIDKVVTSFAEEANVRRKATFKSTAKVAEHATKPLDSF